MSETKPAILVTPAAHGWESWQPGEGGAWTKVGEAPAGEKPWTLVKGRIPWVLGLPASDFQTMALKAPAGGEGADEMIGLRLEAVGWHRGTDGEVLADWKAFSPGAGGDSVVFAWALEGDPIEGCPGNRTPSEIMPALLLTSWPEDRAVLWQEQDRWTLALTNGASPVHVQVCEGFHDPAALAADLRAQITSLLFRRMAPAPRAMVVVGEPIEGMAETARALGLPLETMAHLPVRRPEAKSRLKPRRLLEAERGRIEAGKWKTRIAIVAVLWLGFAAWGYYQHMTASRDLEAAKIAVAKWGPLATHIRQMQGSWEQVFAALDSEKAFPPEALLKIANAIPSRTDVKLTQFTVDGKRDVTLKGNATNAQAAIAYAQKVTRSKSLSYYAWQDPVTTVQKDNTAQFTIVGKFKGGSR